MRAGTLVFASALLGAACSGGFSGATEPPASQAPATQGTASEAPATASAASDEPVTLTYYVDDNNVTNARLQGLTEAYTALHPNVTFEIETHPGGTDGDNLVKTRLATGEMSDIFYYNSGSLFQALNPTETLVDLSDQPFISNMVEAYLPTVSAGDGIYGVPTEGSLGGGILYNNKI
jgi:raffinose/stachyose/melibiose transport system substrate-binding protein